MLSMVSSVSAWISTTKKDIKHIRIGEMIRKNKVSIQDRHGGNAVRILEHITLDYAFIVGIEINITMMK